MPYTDLRIVGDEQSLFEFYLLEGGKFAGCVGKADAAIVVAARHDELNKALTSKWESDHYGGLIEYVADQLATRRHDYADGLSPEALARYDPPDQRTNYLKMQAALANLGLRVRSEFGRSFEDTVKRRDRSGSDFMYRAMHVDSSPEWVYVVASSAGIPPADLEERKMPLMLAALAYFRKTHCLLIIDRDKVGYEVGLTILPSPPSSPSERALGDRFFGHLRMTHGQLTLVPDPHDKISPGRRLTHTC